MTDRTDQLIEDAELAIRTHEGVLALKAERDRLRIALANIVDYDFTYENDCVAGGQISARHISEGRKALGTED